MYSVEWDLETGGIILKSNSENPLIVPPRPVFHEELNLLGFQKYWDFEPRKEPLLWSIGRRYFYRGELVAEARGGNYYSLPEIEIYKKNVTLNHVDVQAMLNKNKKILESLTQASLDFIFKTHERFVKTVDVVAVAFSGGKDSVVLLDLVQRVLKPDDFYVIFNDTTMELSDTYRIVEKAKERWSHLLFFTAKSHKDALTTWKEFGPPSRIHRWCCTVHKSVPTLLFLRELLQKPNAKALIFDGVRGDEGFRRSGYEDIAEGKKHSQQTNARPIFKWNSTEIFLYIFYRDLPLNEAYRFGLNRVGCVVCPFSSSWSEFIIGKVYAADAAPFLSEILNYAKKAKGNEYDAKKYIAKGYWKSRAGGNFLNENAVSKVTFHIDNNKLNVRLVEPNETWLEWSKTLGKIIFKNKNSGFLNTSFGIFPFEFKITDKTHTIKIHNLPSNSKKMISTMESIFYKSAYCVQCRTCETQCSFGGLKINSKVEITKECKNCLKCLNINGLKCLNAASLKIKKSLSDEVADMTKLQDYAGFGLKAEWLVNFIQDPEGWAENCKLGNRQFDSALSWLKDFEIISASKRSKKQLELTPFGELLYKNKKIDLAYWGMLWVNLVRNSSVAYWYAKFLPWGVSYNRSELLEKLDEYYPHAMRTKQNSLKALLHLFSFTPIGKQLGLCINERSNKNSLFRKKGWENPDIRVVLYSIYRYAEKKRKYNLSLSEFFKDDCPEGPFVIFGLQKDVLKNILIQLSRDFKDFIKVEFAYDLENIFLNNNSTSLEIARYVS